MFCLIFITVPRYASMVYAVIVCLSICLSPAGIVSQKLDQGFHKQHHTDSAEILVFWYQTFWWNLNGVTVTPKRVQNAGGVG